RRRRRLQRRSFRPHGALRNGSPMTGAPTHHRSLPIQSALNTIKRRSGSCHNSRTPTLARPPVEFRCAVGIMRNMRYPERLQKLCALRSLDQATLASKVGLSKSSISRILSGVQEPKLTLANDLAKALGVTLDYLVEDSPEIGPTQHLVTMT